MAIREAALAHVADASAADPRLGEVTSRIESDLQVRRPLIDRVEKMSRGVQGNSPKVGQDFDVVLEELVQVVGTEIEWELAEVLPAVKGLLTSGDDELVRSR